MGFPQTMSLGQDHAKTDMPTATTIMLSTISMADAKKKG